jgi:branched-subunit amino acid transport protein
MSIWIAVAVIGLASYLFRLGPVMALSRTSLPASVDRALTYAGPSAMAALTVTAVAHQPHADVASWSGSLLALGVGAAAALRKRSFLTAVAAGLLVYGGWLAGTTILSS